MNSDMLVRPCDFPFAPGTVIFDCRFSLADAGEGERQYREAHIPGAHYLDLARQLSAPVGQHGGRHPLPDAALFAELLGRHGVGVETPVVAYDDSRLAFAARLWWMMRSLGYRAPRLLDGGFQAWLAAGGQATAELPVAQAVDSPGEVAWSGHCDIEGLRQAQARGARLVDSRETRRYQGLEEPIDPVAGHIPGAVNHPWQGVTSDAGEVRDAAQLRDHWGESLQSPELVLYCGSGVTACANLFSLALLGREDPLLYAGSWSDWCSYL